MQRAVDAPVIRAVHFIAGCQRADGSFPAVWGIDFTYGAFQAVTALRSVGLSPDGPRLRRTAEWLLKTQRPDGGWGEHYRSCMENRYIEHAHSLVEMTSWALLALLEVAGPGSEVVQRGIAWLQTHQNEDGSWPLGEAALQGAEARMAEMAAEIERLRRQQQPLPPPDEPAPAG